MGDVADEILRREATEDAERQARREEEEQQRRQRDMRSAWTAFSGPRYETCSFETFEIKNDAQAEAVATCRRYVDELISGATGGLILFGPTGTGKDHLAMAICRSLMKTCWWPWGAASEFISWNSRRFARTTGPVMFSVVRDAMQHGQEREIILSFTAPNLLALSDPTGPAGTRLTDFQVQTLFAVADGRYAQRRPTILTVNVRDRASLEQMLTNPISERFLDGATCVPCDWPSWRTTR